MTTSTRGSTVPPLDAELLAVAEGQQAMLTTLQARAAGMPAPMLVALVKSGVLRHPGRGLYAVEALAQTDPEKWHRQLCSGAFLLYPDAVLAGTTAVLAHGIPVWGAPLDVPAITRPIKRSGGVGAFWVRPARGGVVDSDWGRATAPAEALVQHAIDRGIIPGVVSSDSALRAGTVTDAELAEYRGEGAERDPMPAIGIHALLRRRSPRISGGVAVRGRDGHGGHRGDPTGADRRRGRRARGPVDFLVTGTNVIVEFDGKVEYASGGPERAVEGEAARGPPASVGYVVVRLTWADLERPGTVRCSGSSAIKAA